MREVVRMTDMSIDDDFRIRNGKLDRTDGDNGGVVRQVDCDGWARRTKIWGKIS